MDTPRNPYKYHVCVRDIDSRMHHVMHEEGAGSLRTACGYDQGQYWLELWITQEQLDALPHEKWCRACLFELNH